MRNALKASSPRSVTPAISVIRFRLPTDWELENCGYGMSVSTATKMMSRKTETVNPEL